MLRLFFHAPNRFASVVCVVGVMGVFGVAVAAPGAAVTTFTVPGTSQIFDTGQSVDPLTLSDVLSGEYDDGPDDPIAYPAALVGIDRSVAIGVANLVAAIRSTSGDMRALGISQGAVVLTEAKRQLAALPPAERPAASRLSFVQVGDLTRPGHGLLTSIGYEQPPETPYDTTYVTREYDGFADFPDDLFNAAAVANALAGIVYVHPFYGNLPTDIPSRNVTVTKNGAGATITDILIPTNRLPILQGLRNVGVDERIVSSIEARLKDVIDAGYTRNAARLESTATAVRASSASESASAVPDGVREDEPTTPEATSSASRGRSEKASGTIDDATDDDQEGPGSPTSASTGRGADAGSTTAEVADEPTDTQPAKGETTGKTRVTEKAQATQKAQATEKPQTTEKAQATKKTQAAESGQKATAEAGVPKRTTARDPEKHGTSESASVGAVRDSREDERGGHTDQSV